MNKIKGVWRTLKKSSIFFFGVLVFIQTAKFIVFRFGLVRVGVGMVDIINSIILILIYVLYNITKDYFKNGEEG